VAEDHAKNKTHSIIEVTNIPYITNQSNLHTNITPHRK